LLFELVYIYLFCVETKNKTLEETAALFDGEEAVAQLTEAAREHAHITDMREDVIDEKSSDYSDPAKV
jgi:hypothetical protein